MLFQCKKHRLCLHTSLLEYDCIQEASKVPNYHQTVVFCLKPPTSKILEIKQSKQEKKHFIIYKMLFPYQIHKLIHVCGHHVVSDTCCHEVHVQPLASPLVTLQHPGWKTLYYVTERVYFVVFHASFWTLSWVIAMACIYAWEWGSSSQHQHW